MTTDTQSKPLGGRAYGSIGHLPDSRLGPGDHYVDEQQARILTVQTRNKNDTVIVTEKLDGSCTAVAKLDGGSIVALTRAGYLARTSPYEQHSLFADWVDENQGLFAAILAPGERLVGEWLAQVHGTRYARLSDMSRCPWYVFDLMRGSKRATSNEFTQRFSGSVHVPRVIGIGDAINPTTGMERVKAFSMAHPDDGDEGLVYRLETSKNGGDRYVAFLAKWVRPDKTDGKYLPNVIGGEPLWNWHPTKPRWWEVADNGTHTT